MRAKKKERGEGGGEGKTISHPLPTFLLAPLFTQSLTLVPHSLPETTRKRLLRKLYTCKQHGFYVFGDHSHNTGTYC